MSHETITSEPAEFTIEKVEELARHFATYPEDWAAVNEEIGKIKHEATVEKITNIVIEKLAMKFQAKLESEASEILRMSLLCEKLQLEVEDIQRKHEKMSENGESVEAKSRKDSESVSSSESEEGEASRLLNEIELSCRNEIKFENLSASHRLFEICPYRVDERDLTKSLVKLITVACIMGYDEENGITGRKLSQDGNEVVMGDKAGLSWVELISHGIEVDTNNRETDAVDVKALMSVIGSIVSMARNNGPASYCVNCAEIHATSRGVCRASDKSCKNCNNKGHFKITCGEKQRRVRTNQETSSQFLILFYNFTISHYRTREATRNRIEATDTDERKVNVIETRL